MDNTKIDKLDFIFNDFLKEVKGDQLVTSTMFDKIFINSRKVPKKIIDKFASQPEEIEKLLTGTIPIMTTNITKPYWVTQDRPYDNINLDIYGAICLAADRHVLDLIISHGTIINNAHKYSLRQVCQGLGLKDVQWDLMQQDLIDRKMSNRGTYFHISFPELCAALKIKSLKKNRDVILERLRRLVLMTLMLQPTKNGKALGNPASFSMIDKEIITLLDRSKPKNGVFNNDTRTDLIINVSNFYVNTLQGDGAISRKRLINTYVHLIGGTNSIEDFYKYVDSNKRTFVHGKSVTDLLEKYLENKISLFGVNKSFKINQMLAQVLADKDLLLEHFNLDITVGTKPGNKPGSKHISYSFNYVGD